ncbi:MAG: hypothetical protein ONB48_03885 [candidate division KSB1 bacterium]|nr:hypothetical protein [candidate division KSB1 bacterium]MDZ7274549.1 hypothetical protein [candidate division KSB1 bacterium]MDZ7284790.1 hypothetical protein [candidate division KSB1 bacterium]MDZ7297790.1 hypothetical protein [candidate division KSB1 bacterium]MDZ7306421.1 hypothetical protein [candidate division KSB1 bacterium]
MNLRGLFRVVLSLTLAGLGATQAAAQPARNTKERLQDQAGIAHASAHVADDHRDLDRLSDLILQWDTLRQGGETIALQAVEQKIALALRQDLREAGAEVQQANRELRQSQKELEAARRKVRQERHDGDGSLRQLRDDRHDRRDDRRDRRDDAADARQAEEIFNCKLAIAHELRLLQKQIDAADKPLEAALQEKQKRLLEDYLALLREEIKLGLREVAEDKREWREDRRETREDRKN